MQPFPAQPPLPAAWTRVLDEVDETLRRTGEAAAQRERAIGNDSGSEAERRARWQQTLQQLHERLQGWPAALTQAENEAAEADAVLNAGEEALRRWLRDAEALQQRLAKWGEHQV